MIHQDLGFIASANVRKTELKNEEKWLAVAQPVSLSLGCKAELGQHYFSLQGKMIHQSSALNPGEVASVGLSDPLLHI